MNSIITVSIDKAEIERLIQKEIQSRIQEINAELVFWDVNELSRRTCMSIPFIREQFFNHPDFPKFKIGAKWWMPAEETEAFLLDWIRKQARS